MSRLLEYVSHHPYLVAALLIVALIAIAFELWQRGRTAGGISPALAVRLHNQGALVLDVRSAEDFAAGHIIEARNIPLASLGENFDALKKYRDKPVIVCCEQGNASADAARLLQAQGFKQVARLQGGLAGWRQENLPLVQNRSKTKSKNAGA
jgi:rhodanese-related sulfurtransferase